MTISVHCANASLPLAVVTHDLPKGDSRYAAFQNVCSSTKEEIEAGNAAKQEGFIFLSIKKSV